MKMECPNCKKNLAIPMKAYLNLESYKVGESVMVASECCNTGIILKMNVGYTCTEYMGKKTKDDWGTELRKH